MQATGENAALLVQKNFAGGNAVDERNSSGFEFRFQTGVSTTSGLSSAGMSVMSQNFPFGLKVVLNFGTVFKNKLHRLKQLNGSQNDS